MFSDLSNPNTSFEQLSSLLHVFVFNLESLKIRCLLTLLPNDKILHWSMLKVFADDKLYVTEEMKLALRRVENIMGKGENAGYQHFLLFP